ncbi:MAG: tetratricopeptide repeat protein [Deltaproteobacteria bacterium]|nr:tetratricopeptide repeat protein [Deltaproteobacteria bacterium]MBW2659504.1 tetratricopeptide repeat protein [Deltaproteobacteria bacterium]
MASESAFDKRLTEETKMDKVEGLLEHFNLPPKAIDFIRKYQRLIIILLGVVIIAVVTFSLYKSYRDGLVEDASTALSKAMHVDDGDKAASLTGVVEKFSSTKSAEWARIELAHLDMKNGEYAAAAEKYFAELKLVDRESPLYGLLLYGTGRALEAEKKYTESAAQYSLLKEIKGYEPVGYSGLARIEETQGNYEKAYTIYNNYLLTIGDDPAAVSARAEIEARIAQLKTRM